MVMWIHWNVRGTRPASGFAHLPSDIAAGSPNPSSPPGPWWPLAAQLGQLRARPQPARAPASQPHEARMSLGKGSGRDVLLAGATGERPAARRVTRCPLSCLVPAAGLPPHPPAHLCPLSGTGQETKTELPRLAGKRHRHHGQGLRVRGPLPAPRERGLAVGTPKIAPALRTRRRPRAPCGAPG